MSALSLSSHTPDDVLARIEGRYPPIPSQADAIIIGGGIMGLATAFYMAGAGLKVLVIEKDRVAGQQSGRNWGFVRTQYRDPAEMPLAVEALRLWRGLEAELGTPVGWRETGCLFAASNEPEYEAFAAWLKSVDGIARSSRLLNRSETATLLPALKQGTAGALYTPDDGQAEPGEATSAFAKAARGLGVQILEDCGAIEIDVAGGRVKGVYTEHGRIAADIVVCAAGAVSHQLLRSLSLVLPQKTVRNTVSLTTVAPRLSQPCFCGFGLGLRQRADGSCIIAAESMSDVDVTLGSFTNIKYFLGSFLANRRSFQLNVGRALLDDLYALMVRGRDERRVEPRRPFLPPNEKRAATMKALLGKLFEGADSLGIVKSWAGAIDVLPDALPVIDGTTGVSGLIVATGFSGHGFGLAPAVGKAVSGIAQGQAPSLGLEAFRLDRFAKGTFGQPHAPL
ncbi:NAD(P)/FAD-dependent oxidoreductase [Sphingosinicella microcystinivorans]|uniref:FAD-dependent oxidoreductase n=1 Tax=Sphingosinicella microcystinivorans TaxID=335406 RepID=A0AAD1D600_SPHMI|nr:FAD-binding oxidoreductase [Sphingosinicella microcystinivorans]RKS91056.1 glycine/D-amino acid oxidase-like deaminating enzyme [Sphingosinicella microcystinivorans]BBE33977.1 FAD-dependent oxidoreductase [Sphingosinicella microcystinivorans]